MVLTQKIFRDDSNTIVTSFHTTMVLTQQNLVRELIGRRPLRFHTTMVLTQRGNMPMDLHLGNCFHTTMVLTQLFLGVRLAPASHVWFPYHYGSYATHHVVQSLTEPICFHTTMVLTQPGDEEHPALDIIEVSIPLWFLRN